MDRIITYASFYFVYSFLYALPLAILLIACWLLQVELESLMEKLGALRLFVGILIIGYICCLPGFRAKLATDACMEFNLPFWQAHKVSSEAFRDMLSFLPLIGFVFERRDDDSSKP